MEKKIERRRRKYNTFQRIEKNTKKAKISGKTTSNDKASFLWMYYLYNWKWNEWMKLFIFLIHTESFRVDWKAFLCNWPWIQINSRIHLKLGKRKSSRLNNSALYIVLMITFRSILSGNISSEEAPLKAQCIQCKLIILHRW